MNTPPCLALAHSEYSRSTRLFNSAHSPVKGQPRRGVPRLSPGYEAISYTWGGQQPLVPILIGGRALLVTENCDQAIRRMLRRRPHKRLWIDGACIDQASAPERSQQVRLMGDIYERARRVNVWLGPSTNQSDEAMNFITLMAYATRMKRQVDRFEATRVGQRLSGMGVSEWVHGLRRKLYASFTIGRSSGFDRGGSSTG